jgi:16S rRNA (guanine1207-N2)-methyltransferase
VAGARVLDLGCGYGPLALWAASANADVTAVDDDVTAVRSTARNADRHGPSVRAVHSDLDAELGGGERFDVVLCNPPFHIGKEVRLDVSRAFVRAAHRRLVPGGRLWLVANRALPYERYLEGWSRVETLAEEGGFKVVLATS